LQKKIIIDTIDRRYNTIKIFGNNLKNSILENYLRHNLYGIKVMDLMNFKDDIIYLNTPESILRKYPNFKTNDNDKKCMYEYVFIIRTENIHHYIDLKNNNMCDNILICGDNNKYNIMFQSNNLNKYINSSKNTINEYINFCFNNKILKI